ncbi:hypothetical protein HDU80_008166 [Chytriomyces hyalinus]|nr:hypothetical protein HDU80_008166 [Chytriomyces hyalinus]
MSEATSSNCFIVEPSSQTMSDFAGYPLLIDKANEVTDTASLDKFFMRQMDESSTYQTNFQSNYDCPKWAGQGQRFHTTYYQGMMTYLAQNGKEAPCKTPSTSSTNKFVCASSCIAAKAKLDEIFRNEAYCNQSPSEAARTQRAQTLKAYDSICNVLPARDCITVVGMEKVQAGFPMMSDAMTYCGPGGEGNLIRDALCDSVSLKVLENSKDGTMGKSGAPKLASSLLVGVLGVAALI